MEVTSDRVRVRSQLGISWSVRALACKLMVGGARFGLVAVIMNIPVFGMLAVATYMTGGCFSFARFGSVAVENSCN